MSEIELSIQDATGEFHCGGIIPHGDKLSTSGLVKNLEISNLLNDTNIK